MKDGGQKRPVVFDILWFLVEVVNSIWFGVQLNPHTGAL